jgi:hypothetical protein
MTRKIDAHALGVDVAALAWRRSSDGPDAIEVAFLDAHGERWVLMRVADDDAGRVLVYDRHEWECFVEGARNGEFDEPSADL